MRVSIVVAVAENGVIGRAGDLPWRLSSDLKRFKKITMGHPLIMGRRTYESIGRPLPGRTTIIVTRNRSYSAKGCLVAFNVEQAIETASGIDPDEAFIVGGREIYDLALPLANRLYWTTVQGTPAGDTYFPEVDWSAWTIVSEEAFAADAKNEFNTKYRILDRRQAT